MRRREEQAVGKSEISRYGQHLQLPLTGNSCPSIPKSGGAGPVAGSRHPMQAAHRHGSLWQGSAQSLCLHCPLVQVYKQHTSQWLWRVSPGRQEAHTGPVDACVWREQGLEGKLIQTELKEPRAREPLIGHFLLAQGAANT